MTTTQTAAKVRYNAVQPGTVIARPDYHDTCYREDGEPALSVSCGSTRVSAERRIAKGDTVTVTAPVRVVRHHDYGIKGCMLVVTIDGVEYSVSSNQNAWVVQ